MNRREFWMTTAGATALSVLGGSVTSLFARAAMHGTVPFHVKGLAMMDFSHPEHLTIALPEAPHHAGTVQYTPVNGATEIFPVKGRGAVAGSNGHGPKPDVRVPQLVDVQELYPGARPRLERSPTLISIPWSSVKGISAETLSEDRWTFVNKATGEEVITFRPRQVAETVRFDLVSSGTLRVNDGELAIDLADVRDVSTEFVPTSDEMGGYMSHFAYYLPYVEIGQDAPELEPQPVGFRPTQPATPMPAMGHSFAAAGLRVWPYTSCFPFRVG
jgi:hypothetical protein